MLKTWQGLDLRTIVYVDGFNLYFGCLKNTPYKWLDLYKLFKDQLLNNSTTDLKIKYFTAIVRPSQSDDSQAPFRQKKYIEALEKMYPDKIEIIYGKFPPPQKKYMRRVEEDVLYPENSKDRKTVKVLVFEEKQTDVNVAIHMLNDAWQDKFDQAVLCSNDTDLVGILVSLKKHQSSKRIGVVTPVRTKSNSRPASGSLINIADWSNNWISPEHLKNSQLPDTIPNSMICKPAEWNME